MPEILVITGPTAVGKSNLALHLAREINGEIISADSMQVYRGMDIGTAKPSRKEREEIPHHLIDVVDPWEHFSAGDFQKKARASIEDIRERGRTPILVGGTGFYLEALIHGLPPAFGEKDEALRKELRSLARNKGREYLHRELEKIDPELAARLHPHDLQRVIRGVEVYRLTGNRLSRLQKERKGEALPHSCRE